MDDSGNSKRRIRRQVRELRRSLGEEIQAAHALAVREVLEGLPQFQQSRTIACYWARDGEVDLAPVIQLCWALEKEVFLPVVQAAGDLVFRRYRDGDTLPPNRFGILEPAHAAPSIDIDSLDLVLAPLVAFSRDGSRLGMGGGFYDRAFANPGRKACLFGVAHSCQEHAALPREHWDVGVDAVITELGVVGD